LESVVFLAHMVPLIVIGGLAQLIREFTHQPAAV
jgi:hypothetical protein